MSTKSKLKLLLAITFKIYSQISIKFGR